MITKEEVKDTQQKTIELKEKERIDDLQRNGYQIIQNPEKFCFGMDAVLLSSFARVKPGAKILDMGGKDKGWSFNGFRDSGRKC